MDFVCALDAMNNSNVNTTVAELLQRAAQMISDGNTHSTPSTNIPVAGPSSSVVDEHRRLFNRQLRVHPYASRRQNRVTSSSHRAQRVPENREKTITRTFVCLAGRDQLTVPTNREKLLLKENGLGEKKLQIPTNASKEQVKEVLYKAFRPLQSCGGFEMLLCADNSRTRLQVVKHGSCNTDELRCLGMGRVYIRPIQVDITLGDIEDDDEHAEECLLCRESIPLRGMRAHMETCRGETRPTETSDDDLPPAFGERGEEERVNPAELPNQLPSGTEQNSLELPEQPPRGTDQASISHDEAAANEEEPVPYEEHMRNALEETLKAMATCDEPVTVLGEFRRRLQRGRMLDLQNDSELCEGKTTEIFVSRYRLFDDAMKEILRDDPPAIDFSVPLEVIFTGEGAQDYGGPRRKFLGMVMRDIRDKLFKEEGEGYVIFEKKEALNRKHFYGAGLIFGFSLLQGGSLPTFLAEDQLQRIFKKDDLTNLGEAETQFRVGLERFGLVELLHGKPSLSFLFRKTAVLPMTYPKLVKLLDPIFSDEASNRRQREERTYRLFLNYLKEVSAGRRVDGNISLHSILKFVTGCENEPVLGFQMKPSDCFDTNMPSCLPMGNTCISRLTSPIGENVSMTKEEVFSFFDYAFENDYFGLL